jgi:S-adenosylmethionine hydrolase
MARPVIALLTDFGLRDPYVGAMKGAILSVRRDATLVDVTHDLPRHDVTAAALTLEAVFSRFPEGTTFVVVVDPGVGSARRGIAGRADGRFFVGPDNGLFEPVLVSWPAAELHEIACSAWYPGSVAPTFHGRDVFGPVAARLAAGWPLEEVGPPLSDPLRLALPTSRRVAPNAWEAQVLAVDHFGNLTTSLRIAEIEALLGGGVSGVTVEIAGLTLPLAATYADVGAGQPCALVGSSGRIEIAVNGASAAERLGAGPGSRVRVTAQGPDSALPGPGML